jgi:branched-chain amino acid transport system substrate-binding protein
MPWQKTRQLLAAATVVLTAFGCSRDSGSAGPGTPIRLGTILGLTGDNSSYGQKMLRGFQFAVDEINASGGINGSPLSLRVEDSQFDPSKAVTAYRKVVGVDGVRIIVGITGSKNAIPVCEAARSEDVVIVDALGSAPKLTTACGTNYFRVMASDALAGKYNVDWALEEGKRKPFIVYVEDDWGVSYRDAVLRHLAARGLPSVQVQGVTAGMRDFRVQVERIRQAQPDAVFLLVYAKEGAALMQQLRQAGVGAQVYGSDNISTSEFTSAGSDIVEGVRVALPAEAAGAEFDRFAARYKSKYSEAPDANVIKSYDAMMVVAAALRSAGREPSRIREYLRSPGFQHRGISGTIRFDEHGDLVGQQYTRMAYHAGTLAPLGQR